MENLKWPAFPLEHKITDYCAGELGFTKLEYASLLIAQGLISRYDEVGHGPEICAKDSVTFAKMILEEANK